LARFPIEAGVSPSFEVLDEQTARNSLPGARACSGARSRGDEKLARAAASRDHSDDGKLQQILDSVLGATTEVRAVSRRLRAR